MTDESFSVNPAPSKQEYTVTRCYECRHWKNQRCWIGYQTHAQSKPCRQAVHA
jgi:hypothetical protein